MQQLFEYNEYKRITRKRPYTTGGFWTDTLSLGAWDKEIDENKLAASGWDIAAVIPGSTIAVRLGMKSMAETHITEELWIFRRLKQ